MGFFKRIANLFASPGKAGDYAYWLIVKCNRCGEEIRARVDLRNDLSIEYGDGEAGTTYYCRKILMGEQRCFQQIEVELTFDQDRRLLERKIKGGKFLDE